MRISTPFINIDTTTGGAVQRQPDGTYTIFDTVAANVGNVSGLQNIRRVRYFLYEPDVQNYFASGTMQLTSSNDSEGNYNAPLSFTINRPDVGAFRAEVVAENQSDFLSNSLIATILITRENKRPQLFVLSAPDTLRRPSSGTRPVRFAVSASDSDGAADIAKVFFRSINSSSPSFEFQLFDDGRLAVTGDSIAYDGRYALVLPIDSTATLGTKEFRFWARDKAGALSDSLVHFITVTP
ncbi:MAG: hypothetical protein AUI33_15270 [Ignavibacteria bacterium 13_1_40CM_2_61_4]|nr:MAG: hypothetical protein AUI33_15270 [Ignavibacteria bacterium 13_1_40CM_2_61_4]